SRRYLSESNYKVQLEATRIIGRFGDPVDVDALISLAKDSYGELKEMTVNTAIKLSPGLAGAASIFLKTKDAESVALAIKSILEEDLSEVRPVLEPLLVSDNTDIRVAILAYFVKQCPEDKLEELLSTYIEKSSYYYNVVCWLDRVLYAPPPLKEMYTHQLEAKLG
ncbi:MAG: hypothetical protein J3T61_03680, partial [Candidatus Brocadiales bacterium]|nr:hypothetical protein [Candidatus Bathyanammoxibius sp.]